MSSFQRPYSTRFQNFSYAAIHPEIVDFQIVDYLSTDNIQYFNVYTNISQDISQAFLHATVTLDSGNGNFDLVYLNKTVDICQFLINRKLNIILDILHKVMSEYVELPKRCPIPKVKFKKENYNYLMTLYENLLIYRELTG